MILKFKKNSLQEKPYFLKDIDIDNILISNKISFGGKNPKYLIGYMG